MTRGVDKHLLKQYAAGNSEAFGTLVERKRSILRRFAGAGLAGEVDVDALEFEVFSGARKTLSTLDPDGEDLTVHLLDSLRDLVFDRLPEAEYRMTLFSNGREVFAIPPRMKQLPEPVLTGEAEPDLSDWLNQLGDDQQLLLELAFLEASPLDEVAALVNCSSNILQSFIYNLFDGMADLSSLPHGDDCPPDLLLGMEVVKHRARRQKVARMKEERSGCPGCLTLLQRIVLLVSIWSRDWRLQPEGTEELLEKLGQAPRKSRPSASRPEYQVLEDLPAAGTQKSSLPATFGMALLLAIFIGASFYFLKDRPPPDLRATASPRASRRGTERRAPTRVGSLTSASAASEPLFDGSDVATDLRNPATLAVDGGASVELSPGGAGRSQVRGFSLLTGRARAEVPAGSTQPFTIASGQYAATTHGGVVSVLRTPGRQTIFAVERGSAELKLPDGRKLPLDPGRQATIDLASGQSTVSDYREEDFSPLAGVTRAPFRPRNSQGRAFGNDESNSGNTPRRRAGGGVRPTDVRGFRDSF